MTQIILDESTAQTPIGKLLDSMTDEVIEMRSESGALLGTLLLPGRGDDEVYAEFERILESEADLIRERLSRPPTEGLTTPEFLERLRQLDADE